jgi:hypothetical protein
MDYLLVRHVACHRSHSASTVPVAALSSAYALPLLTVWRVHYPLWVCCCRWNALDGILVLLSMVDLAVTLLATASGVNLSFLRMLRMLRVLRVLRLMRSWQGLYKIVATFVKALPQLGNMSILMFITILIFALMGMQIFGGQYDRCRGFARGPSPSPSDGMGEPHSSSSSSPDADAQPSDLSAAGCYNQAFEPLPLPRYHFDYIGPAMMTTFVLLTGEWTEAMVPAVQALGPAAFVFFVLAVLIGTYLIMNLFIAVRLARPLIQPSYNS